MLEKVKEFFERPHLVVWGYGGLGKQVLELGALTGMDIVACVDSAKDKQAHVTGGGYDLCIVDPSILKDPADCYNIIVTPYQNRECLQFLKDSGYCEDAYLWVSFAEVRALLIDCIASICDVYAETMNCKVHYVFLPTTHNVANPSAIENTLCGYHYIIKNRLEWLKGNPPHVAKAHESLEHYSDKYIEDIFTGKSPFRSSTGELVQEDHVGKYVNVVNGMRFTTDQPTSFEKRIHMFGASIVYGMGTEDQYTLASCLQRRLNGQRENLYKVLNYGVRGMPLHEHCPKIKNAEIAKGEDILCVFVGKAGKECQEILSAHQGAMVDLSDWFQRPHEHGEVFFDAVHFNYKGNEVAADAICKLLFSEGDGAKKEKTSTEPRAKAIDSITNNDEFRAYMDFLDSCAGEKHLESHDVVGATVLNANPFTLGHYHLVDMASRMVDYLYVFVVEEDRSAFSFEDRYDLAIKGTEDFGNVSVIPSGKFIISNVTFPEYFDKDNATETEIVPALDIELFGTFIAKKLGVSVRFVGEESNDYITKQYNQYMREKLPLYGIKLIEIPRLKKAGSVISAKRVRDLIGAGELEKVKDLVPPTTYEHIVRTFGA